MSRTLNRRDRAATQTVFLQKCRDFRLFERETNLTSRIPVSDVDATSKGIVRSDSLGSTTETFTRESQ